MKWHKGFWAVLAAAVFLVQVSQAQAQAEVRPKYIFTDLGGLGGEDSRAVALNSAGEVVGWAYIPFNQIGHAYKYSGGVMQDLHPAGYISEARGINNGGLIAGMEMSAPGNMRPVIWRGGTMQYLGPPNFLGAANSVNERGQVAGEIRFGAFSPLRAFIYENGGFRDLGTLGGDASAGLAINSSGNVAGYSLTGGPELERHAFLWIPGGSGTGGGGRMHNLGTLGGQNSQANGINDAGEIVGWAWREDGRAEAFVFSEGQMSGIGRLGGFSSSANDINQSGQAVGWWSPDGFDRFAFVAIRDAGGGWKMTDLNSLIDPALGWTLVEARAINDSGQIVGFGIDRFGIDRGFLITPVPAPTTVVLSFVALSAVARTRFRPSN